MVFATPAILTQLSGTVREGRIIHYHRTAITKRAEILGWVETKTANIAKCAGMRAIATRTVGLRAILDHNGTAVPCRDGQLFNRSHSSVKMRNNHRAWLQCECRAQRRRTHVHCHWIDIHENRFSRAGIDGDGGIHARICDRDHLIARLYLCGAQGDFKRIGSICHADAMRRTAIVRKVALEATRFLAEYIPSRRNDTFTRVAKFHHAGLIVSGEVVKGDHQGCDRSISTQDIRWIVCHQRTQVPSSDRLPVATELFVVQRKAV